jgi:NMD protein affecting ribosome stability and mRNA decay
VWTIQKGKTVYRTGHVIRTTTCEDDIVSMVEAQSNLIQALAKDIAITLK